MWLSLYCSNAFSCFTLFLIGNSTPNSCLSIHIKADKIQTSKGLNCLMQFCSSQRTKTILSSALGVFVVPCPLQGNFSALIFCFARSFLHCYKWIHKRVLYFFCLINGMFFRSRARIRAQKSLKSHLYWKKILLLSILKYVDLMKDDIIWKR